MTIDPASTEQQLHLVHRTTYVIEILRLLQMGSVTTKKIDHATSIIAQLGIAEML
jgi:hypothetical protein